MPELRLNPLADSRGGTALLNPCELANTTIGVHMTNPLQALLRLAITMTERALRTERRPRCIRGGSIAARLARRRAALRELEPASSSSAPLAAAAKP